MGENILIADSGSSKTDFCLINTGTASQQLWSSSGINPIYQSIDDILNVLRTEMPDVHSAPQYIYFYGAGCSAQSHKTTVQEALYHFFKSPSISVDSDLLGAARSLCQREKGIACILGTGSNSCVYDGSKIVHTVSPLGYILGDEGSGAYFGKHLVSDLLKQQLPEHIVKAFFSAYPLSTEQIIERVYRQPFPNRFLAQFSSFLAQHAHVPEISHLIQTGLHAFVKRNLLHYDEHKTLPIHFTGSIAFFFKDFLLRTLHHYNLKPGHITHKPMQGLMTFHKKLHHV